MAAYQRGNGVQDAVWVNGNAIVPVFRGGYIRTAELLNHNMETKYLSVL
jgi:hypothetical protein